MDCSKAEELLSPYYDDEATNEIRSLVAGHLRTCRHCGGQLAVFQELSVLARSLDELEPPDHLWSKIVIGLDEEIENGRVGARFEWSHFRPKTRRTFLLATAATAMIAAGVVWILSGRSHAPGIHRQFTADFDEYLEHLPNNPDGAQQILLAKYNGQAVSHAQAERHLGHRPAFATDLSEDYSLNAVYLLKMPCCICVQAVYRRNDGEVFAVFEHDEKQPIWFGERPRISAQFRGYPCELVQIQDHLLASWTDGGRSITIVGARDLDEITFLMTRLTSRSPQRSGADSSVLDHA